MNIMQSFHFLGFFSEIISTYESLNTAELNRSGGWVDMIGVLDVDVNYNNYQSLLNLQVD